MKKLIAIALIAVMLLCLAACGSINDTEVSVLWSGDGVVKVPNSLINAMERAMYIEKVDYAHYGANGDQAAQTAQAEASISAGCAALAVELVDPAAAQAIVDLAKAKSVPLVFFNCQVDEAVLASYDKCVLVNTDAASVGSAQGKLIGEYVAENFEDLDRNADGVIQYAGIGDVAASVECANAVLAEEKLAALQVLSTDKSIGDVLAQFNDDNGNMVELLITDSDETALEVLTALQAIGYNDTKLKTHCIPLFTVGADVDASAFTDTSTMTEEELAALIYNVVNVIDSGKMAGTAMEDYDSIAGAVAAVVSNLLQGKEAIADLDEHISAAGQNVSVPYTTYAG